MGMSKQACNHDDRKVCDRSMGQNTRHHSFHSTELYNSLGFFLSRFYLVMSISRQRNNS